MQFASSPAAHGIGLVLALVCLGVAAEPVGPSDAPDTPGVSRLDVVEVTSSRFSEPVQESPESICVVSGEDLRARGATDLRSALALLGGVSVYPGGDLGPAGATPSILGRSEADDFLLLVDGIPIGGAFSPQFDALDLHDVERIEVLRAGAPVLYGTTAFAGTIHVIHYAAGRAERDAHLSAGSFGSRAADVSAVLSDAAALQQSLEADADRTRVAGNGVGSDRLHGLYRAAAETGFGRVHLDLDGVAQWQKPRSPTPTDGNGLPTSSLPPDFDQNPSDGRIDTDVGRIVAGLDWKDGATSWGSVLSWTRTTTRTIEGFFDAFPATDAVGFRQTRQINELFADAHATRSLGRSVDVTVGANELLGRAQQDSTTFDYSIPLDGSAPAAGASLPGTGGTSLVAHRSLFGLYLQTRFKPVKDVSLLAGLRYNVTRQHLSAFDGTSSEDQSDRADRLSGSFGASWRLWNDPSADLDDVLVHAGYSNTFQPAQLDFGPTAGFDPLLKPETQRGFTAGLKVDGLDGRFDADLAAFLSDFGHQPLNSTVGGLPALVAAGQTRFRGIEVESSLLLSPPLRLAASLSLDQATYRDFNDAQAGQLAGLQLALTPRWRAGFGATYAPESGLQLAANLNAEGSRYLDQANLVRVGAYATLDALIGYRFTRLQLRLRGANLMDRLEPVLTSELGDGQYYLLQRRHVDLTMTLPF
jgi:outer membrane receptor protein involved in Fe transport